MIPYSIRRFALAFAASIVVGVELPTHGDEMPYHHSSDEISMANIVGSTHVGGRYHLTSRPFLKEGADRILEMGSQSIKLWLNNAPGRNYFYNTNWGPYLRDVRSVTDLIRTPFYQEVLNLPFKTIVLMTTEFMVPDWKSGMTEAKAAPVRAELQELTEYLLTEFRGSGKTFIITNWESDNNIRLRETDPSLWDQYIQGMIDWTNARQDGIIAGRENVGMDGVAVFGAFESNHIPLHADFDWPTTIEVVVPHTYCDIYSYSNWGTKVPGEEWQIIENLDFIAALAPPSPFFGRRNVFLGEWGAYEVSYMTAQFPDQEGDTRVHDAYSDQRHREVVMRNLDLALRWGISHALYWQVYCNGLRSGISLNLGDTAVEQQLRGVWLIRAPSPLLDLPYSYTSTWGSLASLMNQNRVFDDFVKMDGVHQMSPNIVHYDDDPEWAGRDNARIGRGSADAGWIDYQTSEEIRNLHVKAFHARPAGVLAGWWPLDEWDGTRIFDNSGHGLDGSRNRGLEGDPFGAPVAFENEFAATFNGVEWITVPAASHLDSPEWTLSGWFRLPSSAPASGLMTIVSRQIPGVERQFAVRVDLDSGILQVDATRNGEAFSIPTPAQDLRDGNWHFFAVAADGNGTRVMLNGEFGEPSGMVPDVAVGADVLLGALASSTGNPFQRWFGSIDDVRLYAARIDEEWLNEELMQPPATLESILELNVSVDGSDWQSVPFKVEHTRALAGDGVLRSYLRPLGSLADGMRYARIRLLGDDPDLPQLGNVALFTSDKEIVSGLYENFRYVFINSGNWEISDSETAPGARLAQRSSNDPAWLVHRGNAIEWIEHEFLVDGGIEVSYDFSFDGRLWDNVAVEWLPSEGPWQAIRPLTLPEGARYVRLRFEGSGSVELKSFSMRHASGPLSVDSNGDGVLDVEQSWIATEVPGKGFQAEIVEAGDQGVTVGFPSVSGTVYRIERAVDLKHQIWEEVDTLEATGDWTELHDSQVAPLSAAFYRVRLAPW